jgi:hypothetical protein
VSFERQNTIKVANLFSEYVLETLPMMLRMVKPLASSGLWKCRYVDPCSQCSAAVFKKWGPRCPTTVPGEETHSPGPQAPATRWEQKEHIHRSQILTDCGRKVLALFPQKNITGLSHITLNNGILMV